DGVVESGVGDAGGVDGVVFQAGGVGGEVAVQVDGDVGGAGAVVDVDFAGVAEVQEGEVAEGVSAVVVDDADGGAAGGVGGGWRGLRVGCRVVLPFSAGMLTATAVAPTGTSGVPVIWRVVGAPGPSLGTGRVT